MVGLEKKSAEDVFDDTGPVHTLSAYSFVLAIATASKQVSECSLLNFGSRSCFLPWSISEPPYGCLRKWVKHMHHVFVEWMSAELISLGPILVW